MHTAGAVTHSAVSRLRRPIQCLAPCMYPESLQQPVPARCMHTDAPCMYRASMSPVLRLHGAGTVPHALSLHIAGVVPHLLSTPPGRFLSGVQHGACTVSLHHSAVPARCMHADARCTPRAFAARRAPGFDRPTRSVSTGQFWTLFVSPTSGLATRLRFRLGSSCQARNSGVYRLRSRFPRGHTLCPQPGRARVPPPLVPDPSRSRWAHVPGNAMSI